MEAAATAAACSGGASPWTLVSLLHPRAWAPMPSVILNAAKAARDHPRPGIEPILVWFPLFLLTCPLETPSDDPLVQPSFSSFFALPSFFLPHPNARLICDSLAESVSRFFVLYNGAGALAALFFFSLSSFVFLLSFSLAARYLIYRLRTDRHLAKRRAP